MSKLIGIFGAALIRVLMIPVIFATILALSGKATDVMVNGVKLFQMLGQF